MRDISKELFLFLVLLRDKLNIESKTYYTNNIKKYLEEESHSFGFLPFSNLSELIINQISHIYNNELIFDYFYNQESIYYLKEFSEKDFKLYNGKTLYDFLNFCLIKNPKLNKDFIIRDIADYHIIENKTYYNKTEELLDLLELVLKTLNKIEYDMGKELKNLLTNTFDDNGDYSFKPAYEMKEYIYENIDKYTFRIENNWTHLDEKNINGLYNNGNGLLYFYSEHSKFGKNEEIILKNNNSYKIKETSLFNFIKKYISLK